MGCIVSKEILPDSMSVSSPSALINQFFESLEYSHHQVRIFQHFLRESIASIEACNDILDHLNLLLDADHSDDCIRMTAYLCNITKKIWKLAPKTLSFFIKLETHHNLTFNELTTLLTHYASTYSINAHHINAVVASLEHIKSLPPNAFSAFFKHIKDHDIDVTSVLQRSQKELSQKLTHDAIGRQLIHHNERHAREAALRWIVVIIQARVFNHSHPEDRILLDILAFVAEFHDLDYDYDNVGIYPFLEQHAATLINQTLKDAFLISDPASPEYQCLSFLTDHLIVLATTVVWSPLDTHVDLLHLYRYWFDLLLSNNAFHLSKELGTWYHKVHISALILGVCDKNPIAFHDIPAYQMGNRSLNTLLHLKSLVNESLFEFYFSNRTENAENPLFYFMSYYYSAPTPADRQAFIIGLTAHVCMRAELEVRASRAKQKTPKALPFIHFINECHAFCESHRPLDKAMFFEWIKHQIEALGIQRSVEAFFFETITEEKKYLKSQRHSLSITKSFIEKTLPLVSSNHQESMCSIKQTASDIDAYNLETFSHFYHSLSPERKTQIIIEMCLMVFFQLGAVEKYCIHSRTYPPAIKSHVNFFKKNEKRVAIQTDTVIDEIDCIEFRAEAETTQP